jgi:hypothetical protein
MNPNNKSKTKNIINNNNKIPIINTNTKQRKIHNNNNKFYLGSS